MKEKETKEEKIARINRLVVKLRLLVIFIVLLAAVLIYLQAYFKIA